MVHRENEGQKQGTKQKGKEKCRLSEKNKAQPANKHSAKYGLKLPRRHKGKDIKRVLFEKYQTEGGGDRGDWLGLFLLK